MNSKEHVDKRDRREYSKQYYRKNRDKIRDKQRERVSKMTEDQLIDKNHRKYMRRRKQKLAANARWRKGVKEKLIRMLGGVCMKCGYMNRQVLQFDHIKGNGRAEIARFRNNQMMALYYGNHPEEAKAHLQLLCPTCNMEKRFKNKEHGRPIKYPMEVVISS